MEIPYEFERCPVEVTLDVIGGRWKAFIIWRLFNGPLRFSELQRQIPGITQKMLTQQLREMEQDGIVNRTIYPQVPPKVEYALTEYGQDLKPIVDSMCRWGRAFKKRQQASAVIGSAEDTGSGYASTSQSCSNG